MYQKTQSAGKAALCFGLAVLLCLSIFATCIPVWADDSSNPEIVEVYLGNAQDKVITFEALDSMLGFKTSHAGESLTVGTQAFDTGLGMHCLPDKNAYVEFDVSSFGADTFTASVGILQVSTSFMEWGSATFHVYGDGVLLASSPKMVWGDEPYLLTCNIEGVSTLRLEQSNEDGYACDSCVWGDARLTTGSTNTDEHPATLNPGESSMLGDMRESMLSFEVWEGMLGFNTSHAGEAITIGSQSYASGLGFHCIQEYNAYIEFDISDYGATCFTAYVGVLKQSDAFMEWGSISFHVYGDGELLASSPKCLWGEEPYLLTCDVTGVSTLRLEQNNEDGIACDSGVWGNAQISVPDPDFSETKPDTPETDYEPETEPDTPYDPDMEIYLGDNRDKMTSFSVFDDTVGFNQAHSGDSLSIGTQTYDKGLSAHCLSSGRAYIEFDISDYNAFYFAAEVGMLQNASFFMEWGCSSFHVYGDGELLASSPVMKWNDEPYYLTCDISGVKTLRLEMDNEGAYSCDSCVWGNVRLLYSEPETLEPEIPSFNPNKTDLPQPEELVQGDYAYVSDLYWVDEKSYGGNSVARDLNHYGEILFDVKMNLFDKGLGFHGTSADYTSYVKVNIAGLGFTKFASYYGISDSMSSHDITMAQCTFAVFGDGEMLWESPTVMTYEMPMAYMECDITGVSELTIAVGAPVVSGAWGAYGGAVLSKSGNVEGLLKAESSDTPDTEAETASDDNPATEPETEDTTSPETSGNVEIETPHETQPVVSESTTEGATLAVTDSSDGLGKGCQSLALISPLGWLVTIAAVGMFRKRKE